MTAPKFTPGPWTVRPDLMESRGGIVGYDIESLDQTIVGREGIEEWKDNSEANAHLIAAAPELYEALEECLQWMPAAADHHSADASVYDAMSSADAALAKARGESR